MTPMAAIAAPRGYSRHGHIYVPTSARERAQLAWFSKEAEERRARAGAPPPGGVGGNVRRSPGFFGGWHAGSFCNTGSSIDPWFSNGNTDITHYFGADAEELYLPGEPASGSITGKIASNVLGPVTSPLYQQTLTGAAGDPLGAGFDDGTQDSFDSATAAVHDFDGVSWALLVPFLMWSESQVGTRSLFGKLGTGFLGYLFRMSVAAGPIFRISSYVRGPSGVISMGFDTAVAPSATVPAYAFLFQRVSPSVLTGAGINGDEATFTTTTGSVANDSPFALGSMYQTVHGCTIGPSAIWSGANAETVIASRATTLPAWATAAGI